MFRRSYLQSKVSSLVGNQGTITHVRVQRHMRWENKIVALYMLGLEHLKKGGKDIENGMTLGAMKLAGQ